jgi:hypothetical protein
MAEDVTKHAAKLAAEAVNGLPPLKARKNPFLAFALGFAFGPIGVACYLKSLTDFFVCVAMLAVFSTLLVFGPGELMGWCCSGVYGAWRVHTSNQNMLAGPSYPALPHVS